MHREKFTHLSLDRFNYSPNLNKYVLAFGDFFALVASFYAFRLVSWSLEQWSLATKWTEWWLSQDGDAHSAAYLILATLYVGVSWTRLRHYAHRKPFWSELKEQVQLVVVIAVLDLGLVAFSKWNFSRHWWVIVWSCALVLAPLVRYAAKCLLMALGTWQKPTVIVGSGSNAREAYLALCSEPEMGIEIVAFIAPDSSCPASPVAPIPLLYDCTPEHVHTLGAAQVIIAMEHKQHDLRDFWLRELAHHDVRNVAVIPDMRGVPLYGTDMSFFFSHEVMLLRIRNNLARRSARGIKRIFDLSVASVLIALLSPLLIYIGWKVSRDGGNPIFGHTRIGNKGRPFKCYKFRSMIINAEQVLQDVLTNDPNARAEWEQDFKLKNDPRITPVGAFLRKTSLDELPQLWNVIRGDMSLVGPRPVVEKELERYDGDVNYYLMAKPGMTGLWQVSGRNDTDYDQRVYLDAWYVKNWSLWYDLAILFKTTRVVLYRDGAY